MGQFRLGVVVTASALASVFGTTAALAQTTVTILTDDAYPPYSYMDKQQAIGIYPDILRAAAKHIAGYRIELKPTPWRRAMAQLQAGTELAAAPPYYRPLERPYIGSYSAPMLDEHVVVFCGKQIFSDTPRQRWPDDFLGLLFGNNFGFLLGGDNFWRAARSGKIHIEEAPGSRANLLKLVDKRIDCYLNDQLAVRIELGRMQSLGLLSAAQRQQIQEGPTVSTEQSYVGFTNRDNGKFPFKDDFIKKLNAALTTLHQSGEITRIVGRYLNGKN
ncbi:substrate-binding periplasmic protein [Paludibacterium purpuratum]|uniref:Amino acid ABC transporter substrate-binding protein (PAAT family) n=1 Tax=Paludibacterium purpuratum TaxID=1144873 RepID=A0A4R7AZN1_9NEIS|nr:transporter substrate-binding domain-containing protein [Paludibacterium purpuratum]TDR73905.1 amino acid ABC transporter substrate-binding protein (PAAT family) [Paludibacterium purpuratum]